MLEIGVDMYHMLIFLGIAYVRIQDNIYHANSRV